MPTFALLLVALLGSLFPPAPHLLPACSQEFRSIECLNQRQPAPAGGFLYALDGTLARRGQVVQLKGVNYYPQWKPWANMWWDWNGPQMQRELALAREQLGINAVRILVPYNITGRTNGQGDVTPELLRQLQEIAQIAGQLDMRLIITLFDFYVNFDQPGTAEFERDRAYVQAVVGAFANDERIFAWDIHNEPDHYGAWNDKQGDVQHWLGLIADEIHRVAPRQLVTVGMGKHTNLWQTGPDGRSALDYSDLISVHIYDAGAVAQQLDDVRQRTSKPIIIEEFGWPTDPQCLAPNYTEATQAGLYRDIMAAAEGRSSGVFAWTLRDYDQARGMRWNSREEHFGLYRADDSLKPAAALFAQASVPALPSATQTNLPLTSDDGGFSTDRFSPLPIAGTPYHVKGMFRRAWEDMGGAEGFGLPLGDAFVRPGDSRALQFFERAVLEFNPDARHQQGYSDLSENEKIVRSIIVRPIGREALGDAATGNTYAITERFQQAYTLLGGRWRFGLAISREQAEVVDGVQTWVQFFENGRMEWDAATNRATVGSLGDAAWQGYCAAVE